MAKANRPPTTARTTELAETRTLIDAIARELWMLHGRHGALNWIDVERHLGSLVNQARREAGHTGAE